MCIKSFFHEFKKSQIYTGSINKKRAIFNQLSVLVSGVVTLVVIGIWLVDFEPKHEINQLNIFLFQMQMYEKNYLCIFINLLNNKHT